ncbi:alanyl-tRNA editing protein [Geosporobacter ferrireducens]|uniref:alanyl-tRNA editing protein n=1 Tax=Geosporobacter ferrireducens TaxID=1424294 RepID=UPI001471147B|nr:DHHA1 domain-containing protein [Geosporobacter ferrireducens]
MIKKLYYENAYTKEFTANIIEVKEQDAKFHIVMDQTSFYPEGGGQPNDLGKIDDSAIEYVYEENQKIYHVTEQAPENFYNVKCQIDWERRFDHMQQHLGQHILSACFEKLFDGETIGFHLGTDTVTIDITMENMLPSQAEKIEYLANQIVFNNLHVHQRYPNPDELKKMPLRKPPKVSDNIRVIEVDQFDYSPCGGTHPSYTGEVGIIKIRKWEKMKGGIRVEFLCGNRALKDYHWKNNSINKISALLSVKDIDAYEGIDRLYNEYGQMKKEIRHMKAQLTDYEADFLYDRSDVHKKTKLLVKVFEDRDINELRVLAAKITSKPDIIILFGTKQDLKVQMLFSRSKEIDINMNQLFKEVAPMINGKGGGNPQSAQGGGSDVSNLEGALQAAKQIIQNRYL